MSLAVLTAHFNPCGYIQPRRNLFRFLRQMEGEGVPVFVAELSCDDDSAVLIDAPNVLHLRMRRDQMMWHKENLLNLLEKIVPDEFDSIAWIDADVWFQNANWYDETLAALENHGVAQLFEHAVWTAADGQPEGAMIGAAAHGALDPGSATPGLAWAARRSLWTEAGGLYDQAIVGGGDMANASAWLPNDPESFPWLAYSNYAEATRDLRGWASANGGCGFVGGTLWHEWHGSQADRAYVRRHELVDGFDLKKVLTRRATDGLLEFAPAAPEEFRRGIRDYFERRNEDGAGATATAWMHADELRAIEGLLGHRDTVLEFGGGGSTAWLAARVGAVETIEHDREWASKLIANAPPNVTVHWRRPDSPHQGRNPAEPGQFDSYLSVPGRLGIQFDACLVDGRARIDAALAAAPWLKKGGWLFFHDWFSRERYQDRLAELSRDFTLRPELCVTETPQTLAVFQRR